MGDVQGSMNMGNVKEEKDEDGMLSPGQRPFPKWRSSSISGSCSRVRDEWSVRLTGGSVQHLQCCGLCTDPRCEEEAKPEGEALDLLVNLRSDPHLWSRVVGSDRKNEIANTSGQNEFPPQGVWALP